MDRANIPIQGITRSKYRSIKTVVDNITFASKKEALRYQDLKLLQKAKVINSLVLQPVFTIAINGQKICDYIADFSYVEDGKLIVEDVKGVKTPVYKLKKKLVKALHQVEIQEV